MSNKFVGFFYFFVAIVSGLSLQAMSKPAPTETFQQVSSVGVRTLRFEDKARERPILIELWYPTDFKGPVDKPSDVMWIHPKEIRNSPLSAKKSKYPLIMMSHGNQGDRRDRSWIAEALALEGYLVASVEHYGNTWSTYNPLITLRFWERALDISFAIDQLLIDPFLKTHLDEERIGFVGYSLGGMTGLTLTGVKAQIMEEMVEKILEKGQEITPEAIKKLNLTELEKSFGDPRIKAFLLMSPATFVYPSQSLADIKAPIALVAAINDEVLPHKEHAKRIIEHVAPRKIKITDEKTTHYTFLNRLSEPGKKIAHQGLLKDDSFGQKEFVHKEVAELAVDFFNSELQK